MILDAGRRLTCKLFSGEELEIELEESHSPDPSVGIFGEPGWWAFTVDQNQREFFMSENGRVYEEDGEDGFTHCIGVCELVEVDWMVEQRMIENWFDENSAQN